MKTQNSLELPNCLANANISLISSSDSMWFESYHVVSSISNNCSAGSSLSTIGCCLDHWCTVSCPYVPYTGQLESLYLSSLPRRNVCSLLSVLPTREKRMEWIKSLPKIELHAHLNGSIRDSTLLELAKDLGEKGDIVFADVEDVIRKNDRSLVEVFKLFDLIHKLTTDHKTVTRITREVVEDFALENVVYLELRTTPKRNDSIDMSKRSYMEAVIEGLRSISEVDLDFVTASHSRKLNNVCDGIRRKKIYVRLLLSIDRRETTESAMETVKLALEMRDVGVVGIDLSGNPLVGEWSTFLPALQFAKDNDLHITLHCGEVPNPKEIQAMLDFKPHRVGHACFFKDVDWTKLKAFRIPVEICLTSNIITKSISSIDIHHFADLYKAKHPLILCTDDFGVFSTSLCNEYALAIRSFGLSKRETFALARTAIDATFAEDEVKQQLSFIFDSASPEYV